MASTTFTDFVTPVPAAWLNDVNAATYTQTPANTTAIATETTRALAAEALLAPKASPTFTGVPAAPTAVAGTNTTQLATTAYVVGQAATTTPVMDGIAAVGVSTTFARADHVHASDTTKAPIASPTFTGVPVAPTAASGTNTTQVATTAFVTGGIATAVAPLAPQASPTFTGVPTAPTAAAGTNTTQLATTAFALTSVGSAWSAYTQSQGVTYTNTWGKTIFIYIRWHSTIESGGYYAQVVVNGVEVYLQSGSTWSAYHSACIPVPPGGAWYWTQNGGQTLQVNNICV